MLQGWWHLKLFAGSSLIIKITSTGLVSEEVYKQMKKSVLKNNGIYENRQILPITSTYH
jgi:hypothetical protein